MKGYYSRFVIGVVALFFFACGKGDDGDDNPDVVKPTFVTASIPNGAEDVVAGEQTVVITFDQNITLPDASGITLNEKAVRNAVAAFKELRVGVDLQKATTYTLTISANTVKGPTGLGADEVRISFQTKGEVDRVIKTELVVEHATAEAQKVYDFLRENYGSKVVSGAMANVSWNINEAQWIHAHTGKYPALNGFDFVHLYASPANWIDYSQTEVIEDWWAANGLVSMMWHWNVPKTTGSAEYAFYTNETNFDVSMAVIEGTAENTVVKADIERIADYLLLLKAKNIPVIWRPLHEAAGKWFWWGAKDASAYKKLWVMMFDAFKAKGLNNLIWVWTSETADGDWYPGDDYVDIIGCDLYNKTSANEVAAIHQILAESYPDKIIALTEFGNLTTLARQWDSGATWSWAMPWYDYDRTVDISGAAFNMTSHQHADIAYWREMMASDNVITRDEMPNLK